MKKLIFTMLLVPFLALSQNSSEYGVLENVMITPNPTQISQLEAGLAAHNKKYHGDGAYGARVYRIGSGPNAGSFMWVMGPTTWTAMDSRPAQVDGHDADWNKNVAVYAMPQGNTSYWKFNPEMSHFSKDFTLKNLLLDTYDVKRGKMKEAMALVDKIGKVYAQKLPNEIYGIYTNEFSSSKEGKDLTVVSFFDKMGWIGENKEMDKIFDEVHGKGSWEQFLKDWYDVTEGGESEIWIFSPDLSGISGDVKVAERK